MRTDDRTPSFLALSDAALDSVSGGMRLEGMRESDNVEDRRPQSHGGPIPDDEWQAQIDEFQRQRDTTCDPRDPYGENDPEMDDEGDDSGDYGGDSGGDDW